MPTAVVYGGNSYRREARHRLQKSNPLNWRVQIDPYDLTTISFQTHLVSTSTQYPRKAPVAMGLDRKTSTDDPKKVKEVQMQLLRQGDERTNDRYGKSAPPLRQRARQAHINVSDLAMGEAVS